MTPKSIILLSFLACVLLNGCTLCQNAKRTLFNEPSDFSWMADRKQSLEVYRSWADSAWCEHSSTESGQHVSDAYIGGFKEGFVDLVYAGGTGEPPPVPPRKFWNVGVRNPNGHSEATDWFAGFRHGALVALEEGYRERTLVPSSLFLFGLQEDCQQEKPCFQEPQSTIQTEPGPPEIVSPGQQAPKQQAPKTVTEFFEPETPARTTEALDALPDTPMPSMDVSDVELVPATEKLPQPLRVPEVDRLPQPPEPKQQVPEKEGDSPDVHDIFGIRPARQAVQEPPVLQRAKFEEFLQADAVHQPETTVHPARTAFVSALRNRAAATPTAPTAGMMKRHGNSNSGHHEHPPTSNR